jgi:hypothetical protein
MKVTLAFTFMLSMALSVKVITIDMVTVSNPGNAADNRYNAAGFGSVDHLN